MFIIINLLDTNQCYLRPEASLSYSEFESESAAALMLDLCVRLHNKRNNHDRITKEQYMILERPGEPSPPWDADEKVSKNDKPGE